MKGKILAGVLALITAFTIAGCGSVEDGDGSVSKTDSDVSSVDSGADSGTDSADSSAEEKVPDGGSLPDDASSQQLEITIRSYTGDQVPELIPVVMQTLEAAAGEYSEFEEFFDPNILIEAQLRSFVNDEEQLKDLRAQYDDEARRMTVQKNYDMLHEHLSGVTINGEPQNLKILTVTGDLESSILFDLNFDVDSSDGLKTFIGKAYHIDGKWGCVFDIGEHKSEEELMQLDKENN